MFVLVGALKPLVRRLGSQLHAGVFAAGAVLLLSPLLRFVFYNGYCYDGTWSVFQDIARYEAPDLCLRGLFSHVSEGLWQGPLRDFAMPILGFGLILLSSIEGAVAASPQDPPEAPSTSSVIWFNVMRWGGLFVAVLAWSGGTLSNYRDQQAAIEMIRQAELAERALQAEAAAEEARRAAAEEAAKRVDGRWLLGSWVFIDDLDYEVKTNPELYCATDTAITFGAEKQYSEFDEVGEFILEENRLTINNRIRRKYEPYEGEYNQSEALDPVTWELERQGELLSIEGNTYARC